MNRAPAFVAGVVLCATAVPLFAQQGPGLGQPTWASGDLFKVVSRIKSTTAGGAARGNSNVAMHNGYLAVGYAPDSGRAGGGFSFYNVSNPRSPQLVFRRDENALREPHGFGFSYSYPGKYVVLQAINGIQFWDWTNVTSPSLLRYMTLAGVQESDYASGAWWCFFQAPYVYVGGSGNGIYIVNATDPRNPTLVRRVPTSSTGNFRVGPVYAIGNLMVISSMDAAGLATLDISDPGNPTLLRSSTANGAIYSAFANGNRIYANNNSNRLDIYDITNPTAITFLRSSGSTGDKGGYNSFQDGFVHMGSSGSYRKIRASDAVIVNTATKPDSAEDWDFATALGNWIFVGQDHSQGSPIVPHQTAPDTTPPAVNMVNPVDNAVNRALTSRVGLTFTDAIDLDTVNSSTFIVRPAGGAALPGKYSGQTQILNFFPTSPLQPNTTYEVVIPAGGMRDWSGNAIASTFTARFSTGPTIGTPGPTPTPTNTPVPGQPTPTPTATPTPTITPTPGGGVNGGTFEAQNLSPTSSGASTAMQNDAAATGGTWLALTADGVGDWMQFTTPAFNAGTYSVTLRYKRHNNRGILQASVDGTNLGGTLDQYNAAPALVTHTFGNVTLGNGTHTVRLTVTGRNASSGAYTLSADTLQFAPVVVATPTPTPTTVAATPTPTPTNTPVVATPTPTPTTPTGSAPTCTLNSRTAAPTNASVSFSPGSTSGSPTEYSWDFGDGASTPFSTTPTASHTYTAPGHYTILLSVRNAIDTGTCATIQTVHRPLTANPPAHSGTIAYHAGTDRIFAVNADSDTVTAINAATLAKVFETAVGVNPRTLAMAPDGRVWVTNQGSSTISIVNASTGAVAQTVTLARASRPYGVAFAPNGSAAFVTLEGSGALLKLNPTTGAQTGSLAVTRPRGVAVSADSTRVLVTRFVSPQTRGEIFDVNAGTMALTRTIGLVNDPGPDREDGGRGIPNYISSVTISPDGTRAWVPSKKDNTSRGLFRDGLPLNFENTVRTIVSQINLSTNAEDLAVRKDLNDRDLANAVTFSPLGDWAFVAVQGTNNVEVIDAYTGAVISGMDDVGRSPQGLALSPSGRLFVQNFMGRSVAVYDVNGILDASDPIGSPLGTVDTVTTELLSPTVLAGKQIFYNADDARMNSDKYISCASCHLDGGSDGRVLDFTDRGEGLRNTVELNGRRGTGHGRVHWSANFDEIQDFEHDIRNAFLGLGFMTDAQFNTGTRNTTLGDPKAGVSPELDSLAAYVGSLNAVHASPFRNADGSLTTDGTAGRALFIQLQCFQCHGGADFTDSATGALHNVGTIHAGSGNRLGQPLTGLDTPTLEGLWETAPYLHDGSAATLLDVLTTQNTSGQHGSTASLTSTELNQLVSYMLQIETPDTAPTPNPTTPTPTPVGPTPTPTPTPTPSPTPTPTATPTPSGGLVYLWPEAEGGTITAPMILGSDAAASGGQFVTVSAGNNSTAAAPASGHAVVSFTLPEAGSYRVWGRTIAPVNTDDSFWVRIDNGTWFNWNDITPSTTWTWARVTNDAAADAVIVWNLAAGSHTLTLAYREDGARADRILITNDSAFTPTGTGPAPTPTATPTPGGTFSGYYRIMARHSGSALTVSGASTANSAAVVQWTYGGTSTNDEWLVTSIGSGYFRIDARHSGKAMVVLSASTAEGAGIIQFTYGGTNTNDEWQFVDVGGGYFQIRNRMSSKSVEVVGGGLSNGNAVAQRTYSGATHQQFEMISIP